MKVKELKEYLELIGVPDDFEVMVRIQKPGVIGGTPAVRIDKIAKGFDWDSGKFLLFPADPLMEVEPKKKK
jgi:hypothetical protein